MTMMEALTVAVRREIGRYTDTPEREGDGGRGKADTDLLELASNSVRFHDPFLAAVRRMVDANLISSIAENLHTAGYGGGCAAPRRLRKRDS
jgi:hypothetical protein